MKKNVEFRNKFETCSRNLRVNPKAKDISMSLINVSITLYFYGERKRFLLKYVDDHEELMNTANDKQFIERIQFITYHLSGNQ